MNDVALFVFGAVVLSIAVTGGWLFVYARYFRPAYMDQALPQRRGGPKTT